MTARQEGGAVMQSTVYIVEVDKSLAEYAQRLATLLKEQGVDAELCTMEGYENTTRYPEQFNRCKFLFLGTDLWGHPPVSDISKWRYNQFGSRIGWTKNKCVIYALSLELPYSEYQAFREHCKELKLEHPDVIIPPENPFVEAGEFIKEMVGKKENSSVQRAQYSVLVYEFMANCLKDFFYEDENGVGVTEEDVKTYSHKMKKSALLNLTAKQAILCHAAIHAAAAGSAAMAFIPIPMADAIPITAAQVSMVVALGMIFDNQMTKSDAQVLLATALAPLAGRALAKNALIFVPGVGWAVNGGIAAAITECLGWSVAGEFATKLKNRQQ